MTLQDQRVVIVGGSEGIGLAVAKAASAAGARVLIGSRNEAKLAAARTALGGNAAVETAVVDARDEASAKAYFDRLTEIDHLAVLVGGPVAPLPLVATPVKEFNERFHRKFWAQWIVAKYGAPKIKAGGSLTLTSGAASRRFSAGMVWLSTVNAGIEAMGKGLAVELAPAKVRVNVVCPGLVDTAVWCALPPDQRAAMMEDASQKLPAGFVAKPHEIAGAYLHLMTGRYSTGTVLDIDGGWLIAS
jgi:NAD(P)-dependent dehydrogenase (short-subunit alcohol dehydrogenase family)